MRVGATIPITEFAGDLGAVKEFAQAAEDLGYSHLRMLDHVLGADPQHHPEVPNPPYTHQSYIHEPLTLKGYLAAITEKVELVTGILILPQRQTALVAKQVAEVDVLSGGRMRLGIGVGWNPVEYEALGEDFTNRGRRCDEQMEVLRALWTQEVVTFDGQWHHITHAGINPMRSSVPFPSGSAPAALSARRPARRPCAGLGVWPTAGSPCSALIRRARTFWPGSRATPVTREGVLMPLEWRAGSTWQAGTPRIGLPRPRRGRKREPVICPLVPPVLALPNSTWTSCEASRRWTAARGETCMGCGGQKVPQTGSDNR